MKLKNILDSQSAEVINVFDDVNTWAAPFGRLLLENIPMQANSKVLDIGFGTGFPIVELAQRYGNGSMIYGIDIWEEAFKRAEEKIRVLELENIQLFKQSAEDIPLPDEEIHLIVSNLGVNNFENKKKVLEECFRVLRPVGTLAITTNPIGTFEELFDLLNEVFQEEKLTNASKLLQDYLSRRGTKKDIIQEVENTGFKVKEVVDGLTNLRFVNGLAVLNHILIRVGFRKSWEKMIPADQQDYVFQKLIAKIDKEVLEKGQFVMKIPMLYLEFGR